MRVSPLIVAVFSFALAVPVSAQEALKLSRYRIRLEHIGPGAGGDAQVLGVPEFEERCRDDDGCEITLVLTGITYAAVQGRIFFNANGTAWVGQDGRIGHNPNSSVDVVIGVDTAEMFCGLWDADDLSFAFDITNTVTLQLVSNVPGVQCIMTLLD